MPFAVLREWDKDLDMDELECILANLIYIGYVKGYIASEQNVLVLAKDLDKAFPQITDRSKWAARPLQIDELTKMTRPFISQDEWTYIHQNMKNTTTHRFILFNSPLKKGTLARSYSSLFIWLFFWDYYSKHDCFLELIQIYFFINYYLPINNLDNYFFSWQNENEPSWLLNIFN